MTSSNADNFIVDFPEYPASFFEDEVRDGFYVHGMLKRCWAAELDVLKVVAELCRRHGIRWYADNGTLLGAVRHGGFIPWDDDLDICMFRDDYTRFNRIAREELPEGYEVFDYHDEELDELLLRVTNGKSVKLDPKAWEKFHGFPFIAGIDIFPLDFAAKDPEEEELRTTLAGIVQLAAGCPDLESGNPSEHTIALLNEVEQVCRCNLNYSRPLRPQLMDLTVALFSLYTREESSEVLLLPYWIANRDHKYQMKWFEHTLELPFETTTVTVPACYDAVLRTEYGASYLTPCHGGGTHNYPYYEKQERHLMEYLKGGYPFRYQYREEDLRESAGEEGRPGEQREQSLGEKGKQYVEVMEQAHRAVDDAINAGEKDSCIRILEGCQSTAIALGTMIEEYEGEGTEVVKLLEEYCELVWQLSEELSGRNKWEGLSASGLEEQLKKAAALLPEGSKARKEALFLPYKGSYWGVFSEEWKKLQADPEWNVFVMPIPYFDKKADGSFGEMHEDREGYPPDLPLLSLDSYPFEKRCPDRIYIQNAFDECNYTTSVPTRFYARNLRKYTDELIYIVPFRMDGIESSDGHGMKSLESVVRIPGIVLSDETRVQSERMRELYIGELAKMAGEETRVCWEERIRTAAAMTEETKNDPSPMRWESLLKKPDGTVKKVILYRTTASILLEHGEKALDKLEDVLRIFREQKDAVFMVWCPDKEIERILPGADPELWKRYAAIRENYRKEEMGSCEDNPEEKGIGCFDAYYGDPGPLVRKFVRAGKPVMISDPTIHR